MKAETMIKHGPFFMSSEHGHGLRSSGGPGAEVHGLTGSRLVYAFSHALHTSQESVVLSDTCFLFEVPLHLSTQHGKEGSQEGSSRSPSP